MCSVTRASRIWFSSLAVLGLALGLFATPAQAGADTITLRYSATTTFPFTSPCFGAAVVTLTEDAVLHVTENRNGYHIVFSTRGHADVDPLDPNILGFSGSFNEIQTFNVNGESAIQTFVVTQRGDGLEFHITFILDLSDGGAEIVAFNVVCG